MQLPNTPTCAKLPASIVYPERHQPIDVSRLEHTFVGAGRSHGLTPASTPPDGEIASGFGSWYFDVWNMVMW
jgi:hypothetical protein